MRFAPLVPRPAMRHCPPQQSGKESQVNARSFEAIIFDFGGVITASPFEAFNRLEEERGLPRDFIRTVNAANPHDNAWAQFERVVKYRSREQPEHDDIAAGYSRKRRAEDIGPG